MSESIVDETELRCKRVKLAHNKKMLEKAKEAGDEEKIKLFEYNIRQYEMQLNEIKL